MTWLHALHIAVCYTERGDVELPLQLLQQSFDLKPNPIAARCMAVLQKSQEAAWPFYQQAWASALQMKANGFSSDYTGSRQHVHTHDECLLVGCLAVKDAKLSTHQRVLLNLITEVSFFLQQALWYEEMAAFAAVVEQGGYLSGYTVDAFETLKIKSLMHSEDYSAALVLLKKNCFPTYAKVALFTLLRTVWGLLLREDFYCFILAGSG